MSSCSPLLIANYALAVLDPARLLGELKKDAEIIVDVRWGEWRCLLPADRRPAVHLPQLIPEDQRNLPPGVAPSLVKHCWNGRLHSTPFFFLIMPVR